MLSKDPSPLARLGAMSLLADWQEPAETLARALDDADPALRRWSLRLLRARTDAPAAIAALGEARLQTLATDADARVRLELALAVDHLPIDAKSPGRARILWDLLSTAPFDPWVTQGVYVVADQSAWDLLGYCLDAASPPRSDIPSTLARLAGRLDANPSHSPIHHLGRGLRLNDSTGLSRGILAGWLTGLAESGKSLPTEVAGQPLTEWMKEARAMVAAENPRPDDLDAGLRLLAFDPSPQSAELLLQRLSGADSLDVTRLCLNGLRSRAGQEVADGILSAWTAASPTVKREMLSILLGRPGGVSKLLTAIDEGQVRATDIDPDSKAHLLERATADEKPRAAKLLGEAASADRSGVIQQILTAIPAAGDQSEGKEIFAKHCAGCHRSGDLGHRVGPDLAGMASKSREQLLEDILDPNRQILGDYAAVSVVTTDGVSLTGLLAGESSATITLRRAEGIVEEVPRAKVEEFRGTGKSLMPEGFEQSIAPQQFAHLLAFLRNRP
jgi:putative heme-binding domain-containing protein